MGVFQLLTIGENPISLVTRNYRSNCAQQNTLSEDVVSLRTVVTFVTWLILEQSFLVRNLFYNDIFLDVLLKRLDGDRRLLRCLPNTSTFVPNNRSQCIVFIILRVRVSLLSRDID